MSDKRLERTRRSAAFWSGPSFNATSKPVRGPSTWEVDIRPRTFAGRYWSAFAILFLGAVAAAWWIVPRLIVDAYNEESFAFLNRVFSGREFHAVGHYLDAWSRLSWRVLPRLAGGAVVLYVLLANRSDLLKAVRGFFEDGRVRTGTFLWSALLIGTLCGAVEGGDLALRRLLGWISPPSQFSWQRVWLAPVSATIAYGVMAIVLAAVLRVVFARRWRGVPVRPSVGVLVFIGAYGLFSLGRFHLALDATVILALGLAVAAGRGAGRTSASLQRFNRRATVPLALVLAVGPILTFLGAPDRVEARGLARLPTADPDAPDVLLIILDTVRADALGTYGYERRTTPNIDAWAETGVVFDQALSTAPWTLTAHASMFTGRLPQEVSADFERALDDRYPTVAEVLRDRGYATAGFVANYSYTTAASGLARGFVRYEDYPTSWGRFFQSSRPIGLVAGPILSRLQRNWTWEANERWGAGGKSAGVVTSEFLAWLDRRDDRPFFAFLNYFDAHEPYASPSEFASMFLPPGARKDLEKRPDVRPEEMVGTRAAYDGALAYIDREVGRVLDRLASSDRLENTLVILTSDHGELFGEHGLTGHGNSLYAPLLHVPLILAYPGVPAGTRVAEPATIRDLPATIFDLLGLGPRSEFPGAPLSRYWRSPGPDGAPLFAGVTTRPDAKPWEPTYEGPMSSVRIGDLHYIRSATGEEALYDLSSDPAELEDLSGLAASRPELSRLRVALDDALDGAAAHWLTRARVSPADDRAAGGDATRGR